MIPPLFALAAWLPLSIYFFWRYSTRQAILLTFMGGWAVLPSANYAAAPVDFAYWIVGVSLTSDYFITKATVLGFAGLMNLLLFDARALRRFRLTFWDLPMAVWCLVPLLSAVANPDNLAQGLMGEAYQLLAWGVPYLLGRLYFTETESLRMAAKAFVLAGLLYVPLCLFEIFAGPQLYAHLYGYEPYRWTGAERYFGFRPIGFMEGGNQLGIWMATSALIAVWLWTRRSVSRILGLPIAWVAALLFVVTLLCQSGGSILLLLGLLPFVFVSQRHLPRIISVALVAVVIAFAALRLENAFSVHGLVEHNPAVHAVAGFLRQIGRGSFGWRMSVDERHVNLALERPILGSGDWKWWSQGDLRPWGLWLLVFGLYGVVGLAAFEALLLLPVMRSVWFTRARADVEDFNLRHALAAALLMSAIDNLLNSSMILPLLLVVGGMSAWRSAASGLSIDIESFAGRPLYSSRRVEVQLPANR